MTTTTTTMMTMTIGMIGDSGNVTKNGLFWNFGKMEGQKGHCNEHGGLGIVL